MKEKETKEEKKQKKGEKQKPRLLSEKERFLQINREVRAGIVLYGVYFIWWVMTGYGLGTRKGVTYILGMPDWFFYSCVIGYIWFSIAVILLVKLYYKDFDLGDEPDEEVKA